LDWIGSARNTFAVPATGAGVERQFSKSGRVATRFRTLLKPDTICEMMRYKRYLSRAGQPLVPAKTQRQMKDKHIQNHNEKEVEDDGELVSEERGVNTTGMI
jgi:hypothetical protein